MHQARRQLTQGQPQSAQALQRGGPVAATGRPASRAGVKPQQRSRPKARSNRRGPWPADGRLLSPMKAPSAPRRKKYAGKKLGRPARRAAHQDRAGHEGEVRRRLRPDDQALLRADGGHEEEILWRRASQASAFSPAEATPCAAWITRRPCALSLVLPVCRFRLRRHCLREPAKRRSWTSPSTGPWTSCQHPGQDGRSWKAGRRKNPADHRAWPSWRSCPPATSPARAVRRHRREGRPLGAEASSRPTA